MKGLDYRDRIWNKRSLPFEYNDSVTSKLVSVSVGSYQRKVALGETETSFEVTLSFYSKGSDSLFPYEPHSNYRVRGISEPDFGREYSYDVCSKSYRTRGARVVARRRQCLGFLSVLTSNAVFPCRTCMVAKALKNGLSRGIATPAYGRRERASRYLEANEGSFRRGRRKRRTRT